MPTAQRIAQIFGTLLIVVYAIGKLMNQLVMFVNGGLMPVSNMFPCTLEGAGGYQLDDIHVCAATTHHFLWLSDYITIGNAIWSPGDFLISASAHAMIPTAIFITFVLISLHIKRRVVK